MPVAAALLAAAACSSGSSSTSTSPAAGSTATGSAASAGATGTATVISTKSGSAGTFLTTSSGRTVYLWMKDSMNKSACSGACLSAWPAVTTTGSVTAGTGVTASELSVIPGTKQVAYNGHPLYYFSGDSAPGQVNGQGSDSFGAKWWLVAPSGAAITGSSSGTSPSSPAATPGASKSSSWA